jgi:hypothetical protein
MPIKKKLVTSTPPSTRSVPAPRRAEHRSPVRPKTTTVASVPPPGPSSRPVFTPALAKLAQERAEKLGPPLDPKELPGAQQSAPSIVGQVWDVLATYQDPPAKIVWTFFEDGTLSHSGTVGIWRQHGCAIVTEINGRYSQFYGVIKENTASGDAHNIVSQKWTWTATIRD